MRTSLLRSYSTRVVEYGANTLSRRRDLYRILQVLLFPPKGHPTGGSKILNEHRVLAVDPVLGRRRSSNRRGRSGNHRGRAEDRKETAGGVRLARTVVFNLLVVVPVLLLVSRIHGRRRRVGTTLLLEGETVSRLPLAWHCVANARWKILRQPSCFYRGGTQNRSGRRGREEILCYIWY